MAKIILCVNQKGGVGKTTTTFELGMCCAQNQIKTLIVDYDSQTNLTQAVLNKEYMEEHNLKFNPNHNLFNILIGECYVEDAIIPVRDNLDLLVGSRKTLGENYREIAEREALEKIQEEIEQGKIKPSQFKEKFEEYVEESALHTYLKQTLDIVMETTQEDPYEYIILDSGPVGGLIMMNEIYAADYIVAISSPGRHELEGIKKLANDINEMQSLYGSEYNGKIIGILRTIVNKSAAQKKADIWTRDFIKEFEKLGIRPFDTVIPDKASATNAKFLDMSIAEYEQTIGKDDSVSAAYRLFASELDSRIRADIKIQQKAAKAKK